MKVLLHGAALMILIALALTGCAKKADEKAEVEKILGTTLKGEILETGSGLKYFVTRTGSGQQPQAGSRVVAHYSGFLFNGRKFDSSYDRGKPFEFILGQGKVIRGWEEAFTTMTIGEKRVLIIPHELAYGKRGYPPIIPPESTLIFEVELVGFSRN